MNETKNYRRAFAQYYRITFSSDYEIHHVDFDRSNNDIGNLFILPKKLHRRYHYYLTAMRHGAQDQPRTFVDVSVTILDEDRRMLRGLVDTMDDIAFWQGVNYLLFERRQVIECPPYPDFEPQVEPIEKIASHVWL